MQYELTAFAKSKDYLLCVDSDGCVMDTVQIKHMAVLCPELIRIFSLDDVADFVTRVWEEINLKSLTRGVSRFESVALVLEQLHLGSVDVPGAADILQWVHSGEELSGVTLQEAVKTTGSLSLRKLQEWNSLCNRRIQALEPTFEPFPGVAEHLEFVHRFADIAVISSANAAAVESEWLRYGLTRHVNVFCCQEDGTKQDCIAALLRTGYEPRRVLMVGDALGDANAAAANNVKFAPILPSHEGQSWIRLREETLPKLLHGNFSDQYQSELLAALRGILKGGV